MAEEAPREEEEEQPMSGAAADLVKDISRLLEQHQANHLRNQQMKAMQQTMGDFMK